MERRLPFLAPAAPPRLTCDCRYTLKQRTHGDRDRKQLFGSQVPFGTSPAPRPADVAAAPKADVRALAAATAALLLGDRRFGRSHVMSKHLDL